jgi:acyl-CoA thioesterase FadM
VASRTVTFGYRIAQADTGQKLATASTVLICIDSAGRVTTMPPELRRALEQALTLQP